MSHKLVSLYIGDGEYYTRTDVDNVIAGLKEHVKGLILDNYLKDKEIRRHKYKRCLDKAELCRLEQERIELIENQDITDDDFDKLVKGFYTKWQNRWLAIADKLKEA